MSAVVAELTALWDEVAKLPHARYCAAGIDVAFPCSCPLSDALDLIRDRVDTLGSAD